MKQQEKKREELKGGDAKGQFRGEALDDGRENRRDENDVGRSGRRNGEKKNKRLPTVCHNAFLHSNVFLLFFLL